MTVQFDAMMWNRWALALTGTYYDPLWEHIEIVRCNNHSSDQKPFWRGYCGLEMHCSNMSNFAALVQDTFWCCFFIQLISLAPMASNDNMETSPPPPMELLQAELRGWLCLRPWVDGDFPHLQPLFVTRREPSPNWIALAISFALRQLVHGQWVGLGFVSRAKSLWTPSRNFM